MSVRVVLLLASLLSTGCLGWYLKGVFCDREALGTEVAETAVRAETSSSQAANLAKLAVADDAALVSRQSSQKAITVQAAVTKQTVTQTEETHADYASCARTLLPSELAYRLRQSLDSVRDTSSATPP